MSTPEFIALKCDHCAKYINDMGHLDASSRHALTFDNHASAYQAGRDHDWYIAEVELCPICAEAYAIEKSSEEEA